MKRQVIAIGLDAVDPGLLERWLDQGHLKHLAAARDSGGFGLVNNVRYYRTETSWLTFLTGAPSQRTGEWGYAGYDPQHYRATEGSAYAFDKYPPFYALLPDHRVAVFDAPLARPVDGVDGIQLMGWGTETNQCLRISRPEGLMTEILDRHGSHPMFEQPASQQTLADGGEVLTYRIPSCYDVPALRALQERLCTGARRRAAVMRDLLAREPWDFFLGVFSETHTASHLLWHLSQAHPLYASLAGDSAEDPLLKVFQAVDESVGAVLAAVPGEADVVLFSVYGLAANVLDLPSMMFLPELLYRWSFPGQAALGASASGAALAPPRLDYPQHWKDEIWRLRTARGAQQLESPATQERNGDPMHWQPANWYRPLWPAMPAFALPTYSEGLIRLNVRGREASGMIAPEDFARTCDALGDYLRAVVDARSGKNLVREIIPMRRTPFDAQGAPADLVVLWQDETPTDVVTSPMSGRIGPAPYFRSGGHSSQGFVIARGPGIAPGSRLPDLRTDELTATFLGLLERAGARA